MRGVGSLPGRRVDDLDVAVGEGGPRVFAYSDEGAGELFPFHATLGELGQNLARARAAL